jgi:hypothetical protein
MARPIVENGGRVRSLDERVPLKIVLGGELLPIDHPVHLSYDS